MTKDFINYENGDTPECPECADDTDCTVTVDRTQKTLYRTIPAKYDEEGNFHPQIDPNYVKTWHTCSEGHNWTEKRRADPEYERKVEARKIAGIWKDSDDEG